MSAAKLSHPDDLERLYSDHHAWLCDWLRHRIGCAHQASDLAHDTFTRVLALRDAARIREARPYLATIARGLVIDHWRRQDLERAYLEALATLPADLVPSPESRLMTLQALMRIDAMLDGLAPKVRAAFLLSRLEGMTYVGIARRLNVSLSTIEKSMAVAIRHCLAASAGLP